MNIERCTMNDGCVVLSSRAICDYSTIILKIEYLGQCIRQYTAKTAAVASFVCYCRRRRCR